MIVAVAAWLYIVQALLSLASLYSGPFGFGGMAALATLLVSGLFGAMGYGLLKRLPWARWLALGVSLLSWTLGSLALLGILVAVFATGSAGGFFSIMFSSGVVAVIAVVVLLTVLLMVVSVVISFKLFFYLCSQDGCDEFGVPYGSAGTVAASVGAWIAIFVGQTFMSSGGVGGLATLLASQAMARSQHGEPEVDQARERMEAERREVMRQREEEQRHAEQQARLTAMREEAGAANAEPSPPAAGYAPVVVEEAPAPSLRASDDEEKTSADQILKCRDATGAVTFTQGYCPPGTKRVDMPARE